jgi:hypothetical protein
MSYNPVISTTTLLGTLRAFSLYLRLLSGLWLYLFSFWLLGVNDWLISVQDFCNVGESLLDVCVHLGTYLLETLRTS